MTKPRTFVAAKSAILFTAILASVPVSANTDSCQIPNLRKQYAEATLAVADSTHTKIRESNNTEDMDLKKQGCISDYGLKGGFGLPSLATGLLDGLKDKVCAAADDYIASNLDKFSASLTSPLGLADVDLGIGKRNSCTKEEKAKDTEGKCEGLLTMNERENELGFDSDKLITDQFKKLPDVDPGYTDFSYQGRNDITDYDYATKSSKEAENTRPKEGDRR